MHMNRFGKLIVGLFITLIPSLALAQDNQCLAVLQAAFQATEQVCPETGRNQVCAGSSELQAEPQAGFGPFAFSQPGARLNAREIQTLRSLPLSAESYGVSLLRLQADLPDTDSSLNASLLVFGDVELQNQVDAANAPPTLDVSPTGSMNIRSGPSTDDPIVGTLNARQTVTANGRLGDNTWLRITLADGSFGWLFASLVTTTGDINSLDVVDTSGIPVAVRYSPMQAFAFRSGVADAPCAGAPESGILVQSPAGAERITLFVNGAELALTGTAFLQAQPGGEMVINVVEGVSRVTVSTLSQVAPAGTRVRLSLDSNGAASGAPSEPEPYDTTSLYTLPALVIQREIAISPALSPEQITLAGIPQAGEWVTTYSTLSLLCDGGRSEVQERFRSNPLTIEVVPDGSAMVLVGSQQRDDPPFASVTLARQGAGYYTASATLENAFGRQERYEFTVYVLSPTRIEGVTVGLGGDCTTTGPFIAEPVAAEG
jgi:hypothetical protein